MNFQFVPDSWLSEVLGKRVSKLVLTADCDPHQEGVLDSLRRQLDDIDFSFAFIPAEAANLARAISLCDFELIDTQVRFDKIRLNGSSANSSTRVRPALPADEAVVCRIAAESFTGSRFYRDDRIDRSEAKRIKQEWAANYFRGRRGEAMFVAELNDSVVGFIQLLRQEDTLVLDLIAISSEARGKQLASELISTAERLMAPFRSWIVGTQLSNTASLRLYEQNGFRFKDAAYIFHWHKSNHSSR